MKDLGGRPTKYSEEIVSRTKEYKDSCKDVLEGSRLIVNLPTIQGLAVFLQVNQDTIYEWAKVYPKFSETLEQIKAEQAKRLVNSGLSGDYNSTIAKLILSSNHGMKERNDQTTNDKDLPTPIYNGRAKDSV